MDERALSDVRGILESHVPGAIVLSETAVGHQRNRIAETLRQWCDEEEMDLVLTLGGTLPAPGTSGEQVAPEATSEIVERHLPGMGEAMRAQAALPWALIDRSIAGIRGRTLLVNLAEGKLAAEFLLAVVEVIPEIIARLQTPGDLTHPTPGTNHPTEGKATAGAARTGARELSADEFAAFLRRQKE
jgi:molybdopterin biosynthesis enzyme MoaB